MSRFSASSWVVRGLAVLAVGLAALPSLAADPAQLAFKTPEAAVKALVRAARAADAKQMLALFGPGSEDLVASGDPVQDAGDLKNFARAYARHHRLIESTPDRRVVAVGSPEFLLPVPLVRADDGWRFDGASGAAELVYERIGRNELGAIATLLGGVEAQLEYRRRNPERHAPPVYAKHLVSEPGRKNGLYWPAERPDEQSPAGELVARASDEGYGGGTDVAYHGYYFRLLKAQGPSAFGGAKSYEVDGELADGFAFVAWPAQYRASGVMTFIVNQEGVVYQKDLGEDSEAIARAMTAFDPGEGWVVVDGT